MVDGRIPRGHARFVCTQSEFAGRRVARFAGSPREAKAEKAMNIKLEVFS